MSSDAGRGPGKASSVSPSTAVVSNHRRGKSSEKADSRSIPSEELKTQSIEASFMMAFKRGTLCLGLTASIAGAGTATTPAYRHAQKATTTSGPALYSNSARWPGSIRLRRAAASRRASRSTSP